MGKQQLVARERELAELLAAVGRRGAVLSGPPASARRRWPLPSPQHVEASGDRVERLVATEASRSISFGALAPLLPDDVSTPAPGARAAARSGAANEELGGPAPPLLVIDDAHLLDDHSAATLLGLVSTRGGARRGHRPDGRTGARRRPRAVEGRLRRPPRGRPVRSPGDPASSSPSILGGEVAAGTASLLWQHTRGNALYLSELARDARANDRLVDEHGVWIWRGDLTVPPRLADLLDRRFDGLESGRPRRPRRPRARRTACRSPRSRTSRTDRRRRRAGGAPGRRRRASATASSWYRFAHPMLGAAAARHLTPTRRRRLADALIAAPSGAAPTSSAGRCGSSTPAARPTSSCCAPAPRPCSSPNRSWPAASPSGRCPTTPTPLSALLLADAHAELGEVDAARARPGAWPSTKVRSDEDRLRVRLNEVSLTAFSDRRPDLALELLARPRAELPGRLRRRDRLDGRPADRCSRPARRRPSSSPKRVLDGSPPRASAIRADERAGHGAGDGRPLGRGDRRRRPAARRRRRRPGQPVRPGHRPHRRPGRPLRVLGRPGRPGHRPVGALAGAAGRRRSHPAVGRRVPPAVRRRPAAAPGPRGGGRRAAARGGRPAAQRRGTAALGGRGAARRGPRRDRRRRRGRRPAGRVAARPGRRVPRVAAVGRVGGGRRRGPTGGGDLAFEAYEQARAAGSPISAVAYLAAAARYGASPAGRGRARALGGTRSSPRSASPGRSGSRPGRAATPRRCCEAAETPRQPSASSATPSSSPTWPWPPGARPALGRPAPGPKRSSTRCVAGSGQRRDGPVARRPAHPARAGGRHARRPGDDRPGHRRRRSSSPCARSRATSPRPTASSASTRDAGCARRCSPHLGGIRLSRRSSATQAVGCRSLAGARSLASQPGLTFGRDSSHLSGQIPPR